MRWLYLLAALAACDGGGGDKSDTGSPTDTDTPSGADTGDTTACFVDADEDGYGWDSAPCDVDGVVSVGGDCDDSDGTVYPGADEICDDIDNDCDDYVDDFDWHSPTPGMPASA